MAVQCPDHSRPVTEFPSFPFQTQGPQGEFQADHWMKSGLPRWSDQQFQFTTVHRFKEASPSFLQALNVEKLAWQIGHGRNAS